MKIRIAYQLFQDYVMRRGVLRTVRVLLPRLLGRRVLTGLIFSITYRCHCNCQHCGIKKSVKPREELTTQEIFNVIDSAIPLGLSQVTFTSGEATIRDDLDELIRYAKRRGIFTSLNTNGVLLEKKVSLLKNAGIDRINVSIDSVSHKTHDAIRGRRGCLKLAIAGIKKSLSLGIDTRIVTIVKKNNISELNKVISLGKNLGVSCVRVIYPVPTGNLGMDDVLSDEDLSKVRGIIDHSFSYNPREDPLFPGCHAGVLSIDITPYGDVKPCSFMPLVFGNTRSESINEIWRRIGRHWAFHKKVPYCRMRNPQFCERELKNIKL